MVAVLSQDTATPWPGVDAQWRRTLSVPSTASVDAPGTLRQWHYLDNESDVAATGMEPAGTLLCVHGNPTWSYLWRTLLAGATSPAAIAGGGPWRVIAVDQLDMGFSERTGTFRRLPDRITDLSDFTAELGLTGPVVSVGHDWGGVISLGWALAHPSQLAAVVLTNTAVHPAGHALPPALKLALHPAVHQWGTTTTPAFLKVTHGLAQPALADDVAKAFMAPYRSVERRAGVGNFVADIPAAPGHPSWEALEGVAEGIRSLEVPALMMWGPKDPVFSDRYLNDLITRLPHADVHRFEGASHLVQEDRDIAAPTFEWLGRNVARRADGPDAGSGSTSDAAPDAGSYVPMLAEVDARRGDTGTAIVDMLPDGRTRELSWAQLAVDVDDLAAGLADLGVRAGHRVSLLVPPGINLTTLIYACLRLGAVIVVADAGLGTKGMSRAIKGARPDFLVGIERALAGARLYSWPGVKIAAEDFTPSTASARMALLGCAATVPQLMANGRVMRLAGHAASFTAPDADADAAVLFTSGSTGPAKGVVYTNRKLAAMRDTLKATYNLAAGTSLVAGFAPFALLGPALGATTVTPDMDVTAPRTLTASALAAAAAAIDATVVFASPAALVNVVATAAQLSAGQAKALAAVELVLSAGAPLGIPLLEKVQALAPNAALHTPYGMTEALPVTDIDLPGIRAAGAGNGVCVGRPVSGATVAIAPVAADGSVALQPSFDAGVTGEVLVRAPHVKARYDRLWVTEQHSISIPGWHRTGDVGHLDAGGRLWVEGRMEHILATPSGVRTPVAAEQAAEQLPSVARAAVVGVGPAGTQAAVAIVETVPAARRSGLAPFWLAAAVRAAVSAAGVDLPLSAVLVIDTMPTDVRHNSKIDRAALSRWAARMLAGDKAGRP
ncbi:acyl-coenzyme A synthetase/AMP-(fatty) acid ligase/pimeloyl-ACP methyl ester carboxylesterase [Arthrobacter stackebrandtii]|uniref:Acyl-coenzyme A synthetase/AMP-(Fatty) acid ligase/pimeloyl-ACP methyl ester carboxylesterase n=1 Tax=Arthrobacter stackebrandtii TaxID=272161 RepID=A0ABS4YZG2_9MICC|nr:acyl-coenzyme A synthetase/AMP-(fatty) acid ligase/pimeloyl-ACP methyl ester carboxylesterase [Arthrobacter stackebrandtii]